jgi:DNA-binding transcriptional MerR regulator
MQTLVTTRQLAETLGITPQTLRKWRWSGFGPSFIRLGGRVVYDPADVDAWLSARRHRSTADAVGNVTVHGDRGRAP